MRSLLLALALSSLTSISTAQVVLYTTDFNDNTGWTYNLDTCSWNVDSTPATAPGGPFRSPPFSLNCNSDDFGYAFCLDRNADSPHIDLTPAQGFGATLSFWCNYDLEEDDCFYDTRHLRISNDGFQTQLLDICYLFSHCGPSGTWHQHQVPLDPAWGIVQIRYHFDAYDFIFCNQCFDGWFVDDLRVTTGCPAVVPYCTAKPNSQGCIPVLSTIGTPSYSGTSNFRILADQVLSQQPGVLIWGFAPASTPFGGGQLCLDPPILRTPVQDSGGTPPPPICSGSYSFHMTPALMSAGGLIPGTNVYAQYWSRDPGFTPPNDVGLTAAVQFVICP